jgi:dTDP-glucose 4,6-dehydratase
MKILVTGGAGFIGSNFIVYWLNNHPQDKIVNLDKLTYAGNLENLQAVEHHDNYRFIKGDICDSQTVDKALDGIETIVHFAAESHVDRSILGPRVFVDSNVIGTQVLLDSALRHGIGRFHHVSTDEVFGSLDLNSPEKFNELTSYDPRSPYAASKAAADHLVRAYHATYKLPVTITNCSNNYGPYQFPEKLIPLAVTNILEGKKVPVYGNGGQIRDWLYVEDHCRAIDLVLNLGKDGETYCIGGLEEEYTNLEVVRKIVKILGKNDSVIEYVKDRPGHDLRYSMDWQKINRELGWQPQNKFDEWLAKTVSWYVDNSGWWQRVKSGAYQKYYRQQYGKPKISKSNN